jgi:two-component sensor histidine kinase
MDSLELILLETRDISQKVKLLDTYTQFAFENDIKRGLPFADSLLYYAKREKNYKLVSSAHRYKANFHMYKGEYPIALKYFNNSLKINKSKNYINGLYADNASIGNVYFYSRKYDSAKIKYNDALKIVLENKIINKYTSAYMSLANVNYNSKNNEKAIEYYIKAIDSSIYLKNKERKRVVPVFVNLGTLFLDREDYEKATLYLNEGYSLAKELNFKQGIADAGLKLSRSYFENNLKLKESESILLNCIQIYKDLGDNPYLVNSYINLGNLYLITNEFTKSIDVKKKAVEISEKENLIDYYYAAATSLGKSYFKNGNFDKALFFANSVLKDTSDVKMAVLTKISLFELKTDLAVIKKNYKQALTYSQILNKVKEKQFKTEKNEIVNDIQTKYQTEKKEKENLQLKTDNAEQALALEKENKQKWLFGGGLIGVAILSLFFWRKYKSEEKAKQVISLQKDEIVEQKEIIETLQKDLHHRVKNNLAIINRFVDVVKDEFENEAFDSKLTELQNRIASINEVHQQLYSSKDATKLGVKKYIQKLQQNIESTYLNENITINEQIEDSVSLKADKSFPIGLIINEFLTNSFKYAFPENKKGKISINIDETSAHYNLELTDNGIGFPENFNAENSRTFGLRIMKLLAQQINGTFQIDGSNGVKLNVQFPK